MRLRRVHIKNYKSCLETTVDPIGDLHVLVGPNNEGKSAVLEAMQLLAQAGAEEPVDQLRQRVTNREGGACSRSHSDSRLCPPSARNA